MRVLILGGSSEATALAQTLASRADIAAILSLAGRTVAPIVQPVPTRIGGFGGIDGLVSYLQAERIDLLIDATHPFAAQMARHARAAADLAACRFIKVSRPAWAAGAGDVWHEVASMPDAVAALGIAPRCVFLTVGSLQLAAFAQAPQHHYLVRSIDPIGPGHDLADATFIEARGPFLVADEERLMGDYRIDVLVTKNSGGTAAMAKLAAARALKIPVVLVARARSQETSCTVAEAIAAIETLRAGG